MLFKGPNNCPFSSGDLDQHRILGFLAPRESTPKPHVDRFSRFCKAHERDQQTDTQADHATPSVAIGCI